MKTLPKIATIALFAFSYLPFVQAEFREFTSAYGQKMKFELVSHKGTGDKVTLRMENGTVKEDMAISAFRFRFNIKKSRLGGVNNGSKSGTSRTAQWAYDVELVNASRSEVSNLLLKYQLHKTETTDSYFSNKRRKASVIKGEVLIEKSLRLNGAAKFQTKEVTLQTVDDTYYGDDKKDTLVGIHIRIYDTHGRMVHEYRSEGVEHASWDGETKNTRAVVR